MIFKDFLNKKLPYSFLIKFLFCFVSLYFLFPFYRGIIAPGGKLYSSFLAVHFNIIKVFTLFLTKSAKLILTAMHYQVLQLDYHTIRIIHSGRVNVNPSCLGWAVMSFWVAFVFANNGSWRHKLIWMILGIISICTINIIRIALITLSLHLRWKTLTSLDHHQTFNIFSYACLFVLMYLYITYQKMHEETGYKPKQQTN